MNKKLLFIGLAVVAGGFFLSRNKGGIVTTSFNENANVPLPALAGGSALNASGTTLALGMQGNVPSAPASVPAAPSALPLVERVDSRKTTGDIQSRGPAIEPLDYGPPIDWSTIGGA